MYLSSLNNWIKEFTNLGSRTHPAYSLVFLLSGGGKLNYAGTKRWLDEHLDLDAASDVLSKVKYVLCLDSLGKDR